MPGSLERKGPGRFLKDRLVRLGIPFVLYTFVVNPFLVMAVRTWGYGDPTPYGPRFGSGPLWFVQALFFSLVYAAARW